MNSPIGRAPSGLRGICDPGLDDERACVAVWQMFVRCGFAPGARVEDIDARTDDDHDEDRELVAEKASAPKTKTRSRTVPKKTSDDDIAQIQRLRGEGKTGTQIANVVGKSLATVFRVIKESDTAPPVKAVAKRRAASGERRAASGSPALCCRRSNSCRARSSPHGGRRARPSARGDRRTVR